MVCRPRKTLSRGACSDIPGAPGRRTGRDSQPLLRMAGTFPGHGRLRDPGVLELRTGFAAKLRREHPGRLGDEVIDQPGQRPGRAARGVHASAVSALAGALVSGPSAELPSVLAAGASGWARLRWGTVPGPWTGP